MEIATNSVIVMFPLQGIPTATTKQKENQMTLGTVVCQKKKLKWTKKKNVMGDSKKTNVTTWKKSLTLFTLQESDFFRGQNRYLIIPLYKSTVIHDPR